MDRFRDTGARLWHYGDDILVHCPACDSPATVRPADGSRIQRRLTCTHCAHTATWNAPRHGAGHLLPHLSGPNDPYFKLPLWLRTDFRGHTLWAYNAAHLALLQQYLAATLRERARILSSCDMSLLEQLPAWLKAAKHRTALLKATHVLQSQLAAGGVAPQTGHSA
ncbi:hypothetical protein [Paractinoplanes atraurantiacus]|uniref:Uncharacterized protein n=1 Tax=Paractinoplanes atraurantiacus TaxID=1036182 RepID=A0A285IAR2_9ACTN|nr:hypothetical protein [Actinoplanes atraurantiacus]SNY45084.1 hypothetical protein SAMN05421748_107170 [Actinoplanes atraurantiacus]